MMPGGLSPERPALLLDASLWRTADRNGKLWPRGATMIEHQGVRWVAVSALSERLGYGARASLRRYVESVVPNEHLMRARQTSFDPPVAFVSLTGIELILLDMEDRPRSLKARHQRRAKRRARLGKEFPAVALPVACDNGSPAEVPKEGREPDAMSLLLTEVAALRSQVEALTSQLRRDGAPLPNGEHVVALRINVKTG